MSLTRLRMRVELDGDESWEVDTDQRDQASYELQDFYLPGRPLTTQRFMAYRASVRSGKTKLSWPKFDAACVEVTAVADEDQEVDPTPPDPSGGP